MTNDQFDALVGKLAGLARERPARYKLTVVLLALLGNAYVGAILLLIVALLAALVASLAVLKAVAAKLIFVVGFFLWIILKALWVKVEPPSGEEIGPRQAPELFAMLDGLRRRLGAPRFHHVLVTDDFNAGVVQLPRLGIFGWPRNYLLIGLPLMKSLTVEQFKAVLAHELGHLAKGHGRMSNWIYRQRLRWSRLVDVLAARQSGGSFLFKPFLAWFAPYFSAWSFPMARANEYEADAVSRRLTSSQDAAQALTAVNVVGCYLAERYWPQIHGRADEMPTPGFAPFLAMGESVATGVDEASAQAWLGAAMSRRTDSSDTHPALNDRLAAIGEPPCLSLPGVGEAADRLLGSALETVTERFDQRWQGNIQPSWEGRYREVQEGRQRLAGLNERVACGDELTPQEAYDRATLTEGVGRDPEDALVQLRALHERLPDDPVVCFGLGVRLLYRDDAHGSGLVERAMGLDEDLVAPGCEQLRDYHWRHDRREEAHGWHRRMMERQEVQEAARRERDDITLRDKLEPHGLPESELEALREQLRRVAGLRGAYLARKRVLHLPHRPCYVFGYRVAGFLRFHSGRRAREVLQRIQESVGFPGETLILNVEGGNSRFRRKLRRVKGSRIV